VLHHLTALVAAFEEVDDYDPARHHNQPPPALWINNETYFQDVKSELRELHSLLRTITAKEPATVQKAEKAGGLVATATKKFVEEYAGAMGKAAAALTIGAAGALRYHVGVGKECASAPRRLNWDRQGYAARSQRWS
jgi:hypothetical protein